MAESRTPLSYQPRKQRQWRVEAAAEWHRFASRFTREAVISNLKTLAWVVPLTLLIWIYAEREQVGTQKDVSVPFELATDPSRFVSLADTRPPQDKNLILESARSTGKILIVHEDNLTGGVGAEIAAIIAEEAFDGLDAPIMRLAAPDVPSFPYADPLEEFCLPNAAKIGVAMKRLVAY